MINFSRFTILFISTFFTWANTYSQNQEQKPDARPPFEELLLIDDQTVYVPSLHSFEIEWQQRFGTISHGLKKIYGLLSPSNTRIGVYYVPISNLLVGTGITREEKLLGLEAKYNFINEKTFPLSISYFINASLKLQKEKEPHALRDKFSFFHQLMIAKKISDKLSLQMAPSLSHFNKISSHTSEIEILDTTLLNHFAISFLSQYHLNKSFSIIGEYDQPVTRHKNFNPFPNFSLGVAFKKGSFSIQCFVENYYSIDGQTNAFFNTHDFKKGEFLIGINVTKGFHFTDHKK